MSDLTETVARAVVSAIAETMLMLERAFGHATPIGAEDA